MQLKQQPQEHLETLLDEWMRQKQKQMTEGAEFLPRWYTWIEGEDHV